MKSFKHFLSEDAEVTLDDVITMVKGYQHIPAKPIFRGINRTPGTIVEKIPRTTKTDAEGRRARDSMPLVRNAFNAAMELVYGVDPLFRSNTFNVTGVYETAKVYGDVFFTFFANNCQVYRAEEISDTGFVDVRGMLSTYCDTSEIHKKILAKMKKLNVFDDEECAQYEKEQEKLLSHKVLSILSNNTTLNDIHKECKKKDLDVKLVDDALRYLSKNDFFMSKNAIDTIDIFSGSKNEMFIYGCNKYLGVNVIKLAKLLGYVNDVSNATQAEYEKMYSKFLELLK